MGEENKSVSDLSVKIPRNSIDLSLLFQHLVKHGHLTRELKKLVEEEIIKAHLDETIRGRAGIVLNSQYETVFIYDGIKNEKQHQLLSELLVEDEEIKNKLYIVMQTKEKSYFKMNVNGQAITVNIIPFKEGNYLYLYL